MANGALSHLIALVTLAGCTWAQEQCIADPVINEFFATDNPTCCQFDVCGIPCPAGVDSPSNGGPLMRME